MVSKYLEKAGCQGGVLKGSSLIAWLWKVGCSLWRWYFRFVHLTSADLNHRNERLHSYFYTLPHTAIGGVPPRQKLALAGENNLNRLIHIPTGQACQWDKPEGLTNRQTYGYMDKTYAKPLFMNCFINGGITPLSFSKGASSKPMTRILFLILRSHPVNAFSISHFTHPIRLFHNLFTNYTMGRTKIRINNCLMYQKYWLLWIL